jgi:lipoate-protein ligase A
MAEPRCRLLPLASAGGPWNLAADDALLDSAAGGVGTLRFYGWSRPTLSLGYFQEVGPARADPLLAPLPWLRRPSGGSALVHHHELTYALAVPAVQARAGSPARPERMHEVLAAALAQFGVSVRPRGPGEGRKLGEVLCFLHHTPGDLLLGEAKVVGSAQRKRRGAVLQHGGILLAGSPHTPTLPGIAELTGKTLEPAELAEAVAGAWVRATGWALEPGYWTEAERQRTEEYLAVRYTSPAWNERRLGRMKEEG